MLLLVFMPALARGPWDYYGEWCFDVGPLGSHCFHRYLLPWLQANSMVTCNHVTDILFWKKRLSSSNFISFYLTCHWWVLFHFLFKILLHWSNLLLIVHAYSSKFNYEIFITSNTEISIFCKNCWINRQIMGLILSSL